MEIRHSIKEQVYEIIKDKIFTQQYKLGDKINIDNLAKELHVSNSPIREAISMLVNDGLIFYEPNQGPKVINMTSDEINELSETISILLIGGFKLSAKKNKIPLIIKEMESTLLEQKKLFDNQAYYELNKYAVRFDMALVKFSENSRLVNVLNRLNDVLLLTTISLRSKYKESFLSSIEEHEEILKALKSNNFDSIENAILKHYHDRKFAV